MPPGIGGFEDRSLGRTDVRCLDRGLRCDGGSGRYSDARSDEFFKHMARKASDSGASRPDDVSCRSVDGHVHRAVLQRCHISVASAVGGMASSWT